MKKKLICLLLSVMLFLTMSCSKEEVTTPEKVAEETPTKDMNGYEFIFKAYVDYETFFFPKPIESDYGDKILARYANASENFNCNVNVSEIEGDTKTQIVTAAASGAKFADLLDTQAKIIYDNLDYFMPLNQITGFDIQDIKWGPQSYLETAKFNGENYGFMAYDWGTSISAIYS